MRFSLGVKDKKVSAFNMRRHANKYAGINANNIPKATSTAMAHDSPLSLNQRLSADAANLVLAAHGAGSTESTDDLELD